MHRPDTRFKRGAVAGLLGAATVAVWFFILDIVAGHPLQTPAALGSSVLFGKSAIEMSARVIIAYTVFHLAAFLLAGLLFVWITERIERRPSFMLFALLFVILGEALAVATLASYAQWGLGSLGVWSVTIANILAIAVMGWYIWATHPTLRHLREEPPPPGAVRV
jgi:MFS family permease